MIYYNKLVRDRIPEIMREKGEVPHLEILDGAAYRRELLKKLDERWQNTRKAARRKSWPIF